MGTTEICAIIIALIVGFILRGIGFKSILLDNLIEEINFAIGAKNKTLEEENETFKKKILFFKELFIRGYIESYYRKELARGNGQVYTIDALKDLKTYAQNALDNFSSTWNNEICNEECNWTREFLEELIAKINVALNDSWGSDFLDGDNAEAFDYFFVFVETNIRYDRTLKDMGVGREQLDYVRPCRC